MGIFDEIKSWFDKENDETKYADQHRELLDDLRGRQEAYDSVQKDKFESGLQGSIPDAPEWKDYKDYDERSDKYIEIIANETLKDKVKNEQDKILADYNAKESDKKEQVSSEQKKLDGKVQNIANSVDSAKVAERNAALERGIMNSSILGEAIGEREASGTAAKKSVLEEYNESIARINSDIAYLNEAKKIAVKAHDIKSADNINSTIKSMQKERDAYNGKIDDFNSNIDKNKVDYENRVNKAQNEYYARSEKEKREIESNESKYGYTGDKKIEYDKRLNVALNFFNRVPKKTAIKMIEGNPELRGLLGQRLNDLVRLTHDRNK